MADKSWKRLEQDVAKALGGKRVIRDYGVRREDVEHDIWCIETKYRKKIPALLKDGLIQAKSYSNSKTPLLVVKEHNMRGAIVCMYLDDFVEWHGKL